MPDIAPGTAGQQRNKIWIQGGVMRHFARMLGYILLIPVHLVILVLSLFLYAAAWLIHRLSLRSWLRNPLGEPCTVIFISLLVLLVMTLFGPFTVARAPDAETVIVLERGLGVMEIAARLYDEQIIPSTGQFLFLTKFLGVEDRLQAGKYSFTTGSRPLDVVRRLSRGGTSSQMVTIPEGMTIGQMAELLQRESGIDADGFAALASDPSTARSYGIASGSMEGYLFPDTYGLYWGMPARDVIAIMAARFHQIYGEDLARRAEKLRMSRHEIITLASMIEEEARVPEERPIISAVFHNRLKERMLLQCDPTVIYALGGTDAPLTKKDLEVDSPFNTYRRYGLPPGPISSPGEASILAALFPADVDYLYFVARGDGSHHFSRSSREHINAIHRIRKNLGG
jgi:UPF0755 protein